MLTASSLFLNTNGAGKRVPQHERLPILQRTSANGQTRPAHLIKISPRTDAVSVRVDDFERASSS
jgi:hypothetical protein